MTVDEEIQVVEEAIRDEYLRFHAWDPSYRPVEEGRLKGLWDQFDRLIHLTT